jgi:hypothetical protein
MARITLTTGSCPRCGREVARTVSTHAGIAREHYHCPEHGRHEAAPADATVAEWVAPPRMAALAEWLQVPVPAGVDWVR